MGFTTFRLCLHKFEALLSTSTFVLAPCLISCILQYLSLSLFPSLSKAEYKVLYYCLMFDYVLQVPCTHQVVNIYEQHILLIILLLCTCKYSNHLNTNKHFISSIKNYYLRLILFFHLLILIFISFLLLIISPCSLIPFYICIFLLSSVSKHL